jgi:glycosyltransferase involved in cell wall biosynthesis
MVSPFYPPDFGGISDHVAKLVTLLSKNHEVRVVTNTVGHGSNGSVSRPDIIRIPSITPPPFPYQTLTSFRIPLKAKPLNRLIKEFQPDIIHAHGHHYPLTWISARIAKSKNIPFIMTLHGLYALTSEPTFIEEVFNQTVFKWLLHMTDNVIALTPTMVSYVKKYDSNTQCCIIPNGVDLDLFQSNLHKKLEYREKYGLDEDKIIILYRGRFVSVKGFLELIYAIDILNKNEEVKSKVLFLLVGDGPLRENAVKKLAKYNNCKIMNWTPRSVIHELYIASDIFILPSKWHEAFPLAILEAMAADLYIVASRKGSLTEILEGYKRKKYLGTPSVGEIIKVLTQVILNWPTFKKGNEEEWYVKRFNWAEIISELQKIYQKISTMKIQKDI